MTLLLIVFCNKSLLKLLQRSLYITFTTLVNKFYLFVVQVMFYIRVLLPYINYWVCAAVQGMIFKQSSLEQDVYISKRKNSRTEYKLLQCLQNVLYRMQHFFPHENWFDWVLMYVNFFPDSQAWPLFNIYLLIGTVYLSISWNTQTAKLFFVPFVCLLM